MVTFTIPQATIDRGRIAVRSAGFDADTTAFADSLLERSATPPEATDSFCCRRTDGNDWLLMRRRADGSGRAVVVPGRLYRGIPDPFFLASHLLEPSSDSFDTTTDRSWAVVMPPPRTVASLDEVLKHGHGPLLLASAQGLVDGARLHLCRPQPAESLVRDIWMLIPESTRRTGGVATWMEEFPKEADCLIAITPTEPTGTIPGILTEQQVLDYPDSRYERDLQIAVESSDQGAVNRLLSRRSSAETLRMALWMIAAALAISVAMHLMSTR